MSLLHKKNRWKAVLVLGISMLFLSPQPTYGQLPTFTYEMVQSIFRAQSAPTYSDEFNTSTLNTNWQWVNEEPTNWSLDDAAGNLRITGVSGEITNGCTNPQNLLLQDLPLDQYMVEIKLSLDPTQNYQQGGLVIFQKNGDTIDYDNYAKLDVVWGDEAGGRRAEFAWEQNGRFSQWRHPNIPAEDLAAHYLYLIKLDTRVYAFYSVDGENLTLIGSKLLPNLSTPVAGIYTFASDVRGAEKPCNNDIPEIVTDFDYFRVSELLFDVSSQDNFFGWQQANQDGFGDYSNSTIEGLAVHNGLLYASTRNARNGGKVYRSADGESWNLVSAPATINSQNERIVVSTAFGQYLYAGTSNPNGAEIWRCAECDNSDWEQVVTGGLDDGKNWYVTHIVPFNGALYATVMNAETGVEVWRSGNGDAGSWVQSNQDGFGNPYNTETHAIAELNDYLYVATKQWGQPYNDDVYTGGEVWRTNDGATWTQVNQNGFGNRENMVEWMTEFSGRLYAHVWDAQNGAELWRCTICDGSDWAAMPGSDTYDDWQNFGGSVMIEYGGELYVSTFNSNVGTVVFRVSMNNSWLRGNVNGFGQSSNKTVRSGVVFNDRLYLGTGNPDDGGSIWVKDANATTTPVSTSIPVPTTTPVPTSTPVPTTLPLSTPPLSTPQAQQTNGFTYLPLVQKGVAAVGQTNPTPEPATNRLSIRGSVVSSGVPFSSLYLEIWRHHPQIVNSEEFVGSLDLPLSAPTNAYEYVYPFATQLEPGYVYYVEYFNLQLDAGLLGRWITSNLGNPLAGDEILVPTFDIADIALTNPEPGATKSLPEDFRWNARSTTTDQYRLQFLELSADRDIVRSAQTDYLPHPTSSAYVTSIDEIIGFETDVEYEWRITVHDGIGGRGSSQELRTITFRELQAIQAANNLPQTPNTPSIRDHALPLEPVPLMDFSGK